MTKHNLKDHLTWLLRSSPTIPLLDHICTVVDDPSDSPTPQINHDDSVIPEPITNCSPILPISLERQGPGRECNNNDNPIRSTENMARLQLAPTSVKQPRMLSNVQKAQAATPKHLPTPTTTRSSRDDTPARKRSVDRERQNLKAQLQSRTSKIRTKAPYNDAVLDDYKALIDIDEIDLTETPEEHTSSSATIEAFGEARRLWREDSASRVEPLRKTGRKRTSDEYKADLMSPSPQRSSNKRGKSHVTAADATGHGFGQNEPSECEAVLGIGPHSSTMSPVYLNGSLARFPNHMSVGHSLGEEDMITETNIRTETRRSPSSLEVPSLLQRSNNHKREKPDMQASSQRSLPTKVSRPWRPSSTCKDRR